MMTTLIFLPLLLDRGRDSHDSLVLHQEWSSLILTADISVATTASTLPNQPGEDCCDSGQWQCLLGPMDVHVFPCPAHTDTLLTFQQKSISFRNSKQFKEENSFPHP